MHTDHEMESPGIKNFRILLNKLPPRNIYFTDRGVMEPSKFLHPHAVVSYCELGAPVRTSKVAK